MSRKIFHKGVWLLLISFILDLTVGYAQNNLPAVEFGRRIKKYSEYYKEERDILLYLPSIFFDSLQNTQEIPVLFILDGEDFFLDALAIQRRLGETSYSPSIPEMIIVGIAHENREEELFPKAINTTNPINGKADLFLKYLEKDLIPFIDSIRGGKGPRILFGHSAGGIFGLYTLINKPHLFNAHLVIDPALHWDQQQLLKTFKASLSSIKSTKQFIYLGISNSLPFNSDTSSVEFLSPDIVSSTSHFGLKRFFDNYAFNNIRCTTKYYVQESHFSVPLVSLYDGLNQYYKNFRCKYFEWIHDSLLSAEKFEISIRTHYEEISRLLGYKIVPYKRDLLRYLQIAEYLDYKEKQVALRSLISTYYP